MGLPHPPGPKVTLQSLPNEYLSPDTLPPSLARIDEDAKALVAFLLARFTEDEDVARSVPEVEPPSYAPIWTSLRHGTTGVCDHGPRGSVEMQPSRVLADIESKRRIVADAWDIRWIMWELAQPYAGHPDFREEWRP